MCLDRLEKFKVSRDSEGNYYGYKIFRVTPLGFFTPYYAFTRKYEIGKWYNSRGQWLFSQDGNYLSGFHCYTTEKIAQKHARGYAVGPYVIKKVLLQGINSTGIEGYGRDRARIIVAKKMYIV
jgi:hypothetical protein